jgi:signal transduction histidine kinase/HAMP domain-containing protein
MLRFRLLRYFLVIFGALGVVIVVKNIFVLYALSLRPQSIREVELTVFVSTALVLVFIAISIVLISRLISDRLSRIVLAMQELRNGSYPLLVVSGNDEITDLARGFNQMVEELRTRDDKLKSWAGRRETEMARLSQNLEVERGKLETVLQSIGEGVIVLDNDNRVLMANRRVAEIFDIQPENMPGTDLGTLISHVRDRLLNPESVDVQFHDLQRNQGTVDEIVLQLDEPNGPEIRLYCTPVRGVNGKLFGRIATSLDMSRERELDRLKSEFVSTISHELRTPLTSIKGSLGLIKTGAVGPVSSDLRELLDIALSNTERLVNTINDMLDIGQLERGHMRMSTINLALEPAIEQALRVIQRPAKQQNISIEVKLPPDLPTVVADPRRVEQVLVNLLSNAVKFSERDKRVIVSAAEQGNEVVISVQDFGVGISQDFQERLFDKFEHQQGALTRERQGSGLGLAISKQIVKALGGRIWVESEVGKGATFHFSLPIAHHAVVRAEEQRRPLPGDSSRRLILVIEDDEDAARVISYALELQGHRVISCPNGKEAMQLVRRHHPDMITLDLSIPGMNGFEVLKELRAEPGTQKLPIVCISAQPDPKQAIDRGADYYLEKPIEIERLREITEKAFASGIGETAAWH